MLPDRYTVWSWRSMNNKWLWYPEKDGLSFQKADLARIRLEAQRGVRVIVLPDGIRPRNEWAAQSCATPTLYSVWTRGGSEGAQLVDRIATDLTKEEAERLRAEMLANIPTLEVWVQEEKES